jgi:hypothetical protein
MEHNYNPPEAGISVACEGFRSQGLRPPTKSQLQVHAFGAVAERAILCQVIERFAASLLQVFECKLSRG